MVDFIKKQDDCGYEWIDLTQPSNEELRNIASEYELHLPSVMDSLQPEHLPKYEEIEDLAFIMLRVYDNNAKQEADTIQELSRKIALFYTKERLITIHSVELPIINSLKTEAVYARKCSSSIMTVFYIVNKVLQSYEAPAHRLLQELDKYETDIFLKTEVPSVLKSLYHLRRKAAVSRRILHLSKDILDHLDNHDLPETLVQDIRDLYVRLETMYDEVLEGSGNLLNIYISLSSQKTNEVVRVLTVFSVFFMPLTFIVGVYGMNFEFMPELQMKYGYPGVMTVMAVLTGSIYFWFKRKGWL